MDEINGGLAGGTLLLGGLDAASDELGRVSGRYLGGPIIRFNPARDR